MKTKVPLKILKIDNDGFHISVSAKINGKNAHLVVDTGASRTVFDKERIKKYLKEGKITDLDNLSTGLGTNSMQSQMTEIKKLQIGNFVIENYSCVLLDLSHVVQSYEAIGLKPVEGVIGSDVLKKYKAIVSYPGRMLILTSDKKKSKKRKR